MTTKLSHEFEHQAQKYLVIIIDHGTTLTVQGFKDGAAVTPAYTANKAESERFDSLVKRDTVMDLAIFVKESIQGKTRKTL